MMSTKNTKCLSDWFRQWRAPLRKFLTRKGGVRAADLDDVAQEVFLRLLRYDRAELIEHPRAYLFKMATNVAAEWAIRARSTNPHEPKWLAGLSADDEPEENVAQEGIQDRVERALNTLSPRQRQVLKLQFTEELGYAAIAARLGLTHRSVKRIVVKSYDRLRNELDAELLGVINRGRE
jgi:RNA polymerase sigma-70 factor (ECF subfamily)